MNKIAFIFPGQGSQYVGMGKTLYDNFPIAKSTFEEAEKVLGYDIKKICFEGPFEKLTEPSYIQPAILVVSVAAFRVFEKEIGIKADILLGHSFGELSSLACAGALSFAEALQVARLKGEYAEAAVRGVDSGMATVRGLKPEKVQEICKKISKNTLLVNIGIINSPNQVVISGHDAALEKAEKAITKIGGTFERLRVKAAFHSPLLKKATEKIKKDLCKIKFKKLKTPVLSPMTGQIYQDTDYEGMIENLSGSLSRVALWLEPVQELQKLGIGTSIEIGPQKVLSNLIPEITEDLEVLTFNKYLDLAILKKRFGLDREGKIELIVRCLRIAVCTKNNNWDNDQYEKGVATPYRQIKNRLLEIRQKEVEPSLADVKEALLMLDSVFTTKGTDDETRKLRYQEIFSENFENVRSIFAADKKLNFLR